MTYTFECKKCGKITVIDTDYEKYAKDEKRKFEKHEKKLQGEEEMKKLVSFKILKIVCGFEWESECLHQENEEKPCNSKNCPFWKKWETYEPNTAKVKV
jgi:hypothetical protein